MFKRFISLTLLWSFVVLFISSVVLFIEPHGRVAFWSNWHFLWLSKGQWDDLHLCSGTVFSIAAILHLYLNWQIVVAYLKKKIRGSSGSPAVWGSLALTLFICISSYFHLPPMKQLIELKEKIKQVQTKKYGNPPFGHAELVSINKLARFLGINPKEFLEALRANGIKITSGKESLKELSLKTGKSPSELFHLAMRYLNKDSGKKGAIRLPAVPPPGTGMMTINDIAHTYHISSEKLIERLKAFGIDATPSETIKEIAEKSDKSPHEIYSILSKSK